MADRDHDDWTDYDWWLEFGYGEYPHDMTEEELCGFAPGDQ